MKERRDPDSNLVIRDKQFQLNVLLDDIGLIGMMAEKIREQLPDGPAHPDMARDLDVILARQQHLLQLVEHLIQSGQLIQQGND